MSQAKETTSNSTRSKIATPVSQRTMLHYTSSTKTQTKRGHGAVDPKTPSPDQNRTISRSNPTHPTIALDEDFLLQIKETLREVVKEELKTDLATIQTSLTELHKKYDEVKNELEDVKKHSEAEISSLQNALKFQMDKNSNLEKRVQSLEHSNSNPGLKLYNVADSARELPVQAELKLINIAARSLIDLPPIAISHISREGAYTDGKRRPINVSFMHPKDKQLLLTHSKSIYADSKVSIKEDLPEYIIESNKILLPILKAARFYKHFATLDKDQLNIDGKIYTVDDLHLLPDYLLPSRATTLSKDAMTVFFKGSSTFSNHYPCTFTIDNEQFNCSEQSYFYSKAKFFKDEYTAQEILNENNPVLQKKLAKSIKNVVEENWAQVKENYMYKSLKAKFTQNILLKNVLLETNNNVLVEGNPNDNYWSAGLSVYSRDIWKSSLWPGKNRLGKLLEEIRSELKSHE